MPLFADRKEAGRKLADELAGLKLTGAATGNIVALGLVRGGVPVASQVAQALDAPLDVIVARKIGVPWRPELAMGAIAGAAEILDLREIALLRIPQREVDAAIARERRELERREALYRSGRKPLELKGRIVILMDDGLATGSTMLAAVRAVRVQNPARVIAAVPVGSRDACERVKKEVDSLLCLATPEPFTAVGRWYRDFSQIDDAEVQRLLQGERV